MSWFFVLRQVRSKNAKLKIQNAKSLLAESSTLIKPDKSGSPSFILIDC
jgi:hypothetical protein